MKAYLYWVTSAEPEDWFIVAPSESIASACHEHGEGLNEGDTKTELICEISHKLEVQYRGAKHNVLREGYWPSLELLEVLGFQFIEKSPPYILKKNGRVFRQGGSAYELMLSKHDGIGVYIVKVRDTNKYKIGYTKDIDRRLREFKTGSPYAIDLHFFLFTERTRQVERELHSLLSAYKTVGEWFEIDNRNELIIAIDTISLKYDIKSLDSSWLIGR